MRALRIIGAGVCPALSDPDDIFDALRISKDREREREIRTALIGYALLVVKEQGGTFRDVIGYILPREERRADDRSVERARQERLLLALAEHAKRRGLNYVDNR